MLCESSLNINDSCKDMETMNLLRISRRHIFISILSACLLCVLGLFLYSEYRFASSVSNQSSVSSEKAPAKEAIQQANTSENTVVAQPDKSLPVPAHQLKKIVAEPVQQDQLDKAIASADQIIAALDQSIKNNFEQLPVQAQILSVKAGDNDAQVLDQRIENIRNHLKTIN